MKVVVIGGGYSGIITALSIKKNNPYNEVIVLEQNDRILKKLKVTGNGKCNINNINDDIYAYNHPEFIKRYFDIYDVNKQNKFLNDLGIYLKVMNNTGLYPISESANNVVNILLRDLSYYGVKVICNSKVIDYTAKEGRYILKIENSKDIETDIIIIATSLKSSPKINGDTSFINILRSHGYKVTTLLAGLCPLKVKENVTSLFGVRIKGEVRFNDFIEEGEILFKRDGLSGIVIMDLSSYIARSHIKDGLIAIRLLDNISKEEFININKYMDNPLLSIANKELANYIYNELDIKPSINMSKENIDKIYDKLEHLTFHFKELYSYDDSHVTVGGINLDEIDENLMSKREDNVYFVGEVLDIDGKCGGFNLKWGLVSSLIVSKKVNQ